MTARAQLFARLALLLAILATAVALKAELAIEAGWGTDGQYYQHLASHVRDGDGLVSRVSLYHQGFQEWPHRVNQAPLWPVTLGLAARVAPLEWLARRLPEALSLLDLLLLYVLGNRLWRRVAADGGTLAERLGTARFGVPDFGHVAVLLFAFNPTWFRFTSAPYSEGLAFALLFGALLALDRAVDGARRGWGFVAGACAAAAVLARGQMIALPIAVLLVLGIAAARRAEARMPFGLAAAGALAVFAPWIAYLASWVPALTPTVILGMATQPQTPSLPAFAFWVPTEGALDYLRDRLGGLVIAFTPGHRFSYFHSHGPAAALVPAGLLLAAWAAWRGRFSLADCARPRWLLLLAMLLAGAGMLAPIHHAHAKILFEWMFGHRHGLPLLLLILPAAAGFCALPRRAPAVLVLMLALGGAGLGAWELHGSVRRSPLTEWDHRLAAWIDAQEPPPVVVSTAPSALAGVSRRGRFHWMACDEPPQALAALLDDAGATHVVVNPWEESCAFLAGWRTRLEPAQVFGEGKLVVLRKRHGSGPSVR